MKDKKADRKLRKNKVLMSKKEKAAARDANLKVLKECALDPQLAQVLVSSKDFGNKSVKDQLKVELQREKLGISFDQTLYQTVKEHPEGFVPSPQVKVPIYKPQIHNKVHFSESDTEPVIQPSKVEFYQPVSEPVPYEPVEIPALDPLVLMGYSEGTKNENTEQVVVEETLPIIHMEQEIIEKVKFSPVTIICGETGCGKSTQLPRFLLENHLGDSGKIGITQPRRIAAITLARRVAEETGLKLGEEIGYQVRYDSSTISKKNRIKFMTDGILLKELSSDFLLSDYSVIIIDEAHERGINTDILLGLISRVIKIRKENPLKLIIMSATIRIDDFASNPSLFDSPPIINIQSRQYPVSIHFAKSTKSEDYIDQCFSKSLKIHKNLPPGGILIFVPGKKDVLSLKSRLKHALNPAETLVLGLYSMLPISKQVKIFNPSPNKRMIVISTNVSETSVTIPGIVYVIDSGLEKRKVYSGQLQMSKFIICHISQASASQRAGRAGRTAPGHCYRLYSAAAFHNVFSDFRPPDVLSFPLHSIILQLKALGIKNVHKFPFPTPPAEEFLDKALEELFELGALEQYRKGKGDIYSINELGRELAELPLAPRYSKMLLLGHKLNVDKYVAVVVAGMEVDQLFENQGKDHGKKQLAEGKKVRSSWFKGKSDSLIVLRMLIDAAKANDTQSFCQKYGVIEKSVKEIFELSLQVYNILNNTKFTDFSQMNVKIPTLEEESLVQKSIVSGLIDQVCVKVYSASDNKSTKHVPYLCQKHLDLSLYSEDYKRSGANLEFVFIHPSSYFFARSPPDIITYQHLVFTQRPSLLNITEVQTEWLYELGGYFMHDVKVENDSYAFFDHKTDQVKTKVLGAYGKQKWNLPATIAEFPECDLKYFHFAKFLMDGTLCGDPGILRFWKVKVGKFVGKEMIAVQRELKKRKISKVEKLAEEVRKNERFLIGELRQAAKEEFCGEIESFWKCFSLS